MTTIQEALDKVQEAMKGAAELERIRIIAALRAADGIGSAAEAIAVVEALGKPPVRMCLECGKPIPAGLQPVKEMTSCSLACADEIARRYLATKGRGPW